MQIVIDINDNEYKSIKSYPNNNTSYPITLHLYKAVRNGTPLPKGHGRLIDADELHHCECKDNFNECDTCIDADLCSLVNDANTIIPSDKEE